MAPVRRYLRITKYSVLECRIYLDNPALSEIWLLRKNDPALPRIIEAVRPLVLPKLREENERSKTKKTGKGKQAIKDVVVQDDFEVSIFLKEQGSRHSLLTKTKNFSDKPKLKSNSNKLTGWLSGGTTDKPINVEAGPGIILLEDDDDIDLSAIPQAPTGGLGMDVDDAVTLPSDDDADDLFVRENEDDNTGAGEDKKKLGMKTIYDGFSIYGKMLCLIVKRRGVPATIKSGSGQAMMENWVSTQVEKELGLENDDP